MTPLLIRPSVQTDQTGMQAILGSIDLFPTDMLPDLMSPYLAGQSNHCWLSALIEDQVVGFVFVEQEAMTQAAWNMRAIGVHADHQGHGFGKKLVQATESHIHGKGGQTLVIDTSGVESFISVRQFYKSLGYLIVGEIPHFWGPDDAKVIFCKQLA